MDQACEQFEDQPLPHPNSPVLDGPNLADTALLHLWGLYQESWKIKCEQIISHATWCRHSTAEVWFSTFGHRFSFIRQATDKNASFIYHMQLKSLE